MRVVILYGGWSDEKNYTAHREVKKAVEELKYEHILVTINENNWIQKIMDYKADVVFITNQGNFGEDGMIQGTLDLYGIKYVGSGVLASALIMNKFQYKRMLKYLNIKTPRFLVLKYEDEIPKYEDIVEKLGDKFIIKPVSNGASIGVELINNYSQFYRVKNARERFKDILVEEFISGEKTELGVGVIETNGEILELPICMINYKGEFFSNDLKFTGENVVEKYCVANNEILNNAVNIAKKIHKEFGCSGLSRTDMVMKKTEKSMF